MRLALALSFATSVVGLSRCADCASCFYRESSTSAGRRKRLKLHLHRRGPTSCAASTARIAPTTICSSTTSTSASIRRRNSSAARTRSASRCSRTTTRIQLDLHAALNVDKILLGDTALKYERDSGAVFVDFPETLRAGRTYIDRLLLLRQSRRDRPLRRHHVSGRIRPATPGSTPPAKASAPASGGRTRISGATRSRAWTSASSIPNDLVDVSNGKFIGKTDLGDGYTRWDWLVHYPINNYDVSLNIGNYEHFADRLGDLPLDFYALPEDLEKAKKQFAQAKGMLEAYQHYFGEYPFKKDGYKLIEVPYSGMEHQSAVTYGNHFANGYLERDWTGVGISPRFDFIIIHESGHEWFGNSVYRRRRLRHVDSRRLDDLSRVPLRRVHVRATTTP